MGLNISRRLIAFISLLVFLLAIYGSAFGAVGCHSAGEGFQSLECNKKHQPLGVPHIDDGTRNLCACDPLACNVLKFRSKVKRPAFQSELAFQFSSLQLTPASTTALPYTTDWKFLHFPLQSLLLLRTVVLLH